MNNLFGSEILTTMVCWDCRITFGGGHETCSQCKKPLYNAGKRFKTPKKNDIKGWKEARALRERMKKNNARWHDPNIVGRWMLEDMGPKKKMPKGK